ncbi:hypothetical protein BANRA_02402 [Klebsiella pneumoniae]|nr:hypothetical protein BANRA_02402 [Klebsiella pneumoniae]
MRGYNFTNIDIFITKAVSSITPAIHVPSDFNKTGLLIIITPYLMVAGITHVIKLHLKTIIRVNTHH